jgi:hypothetical protein
VRSSWSGSSSFPVLSLDGTDETPFSSCATYLFSTPPIPHGSHAASTAGNGNSDLYNGLAGTFCLIAYLFFDGLVSTTQERVFGKVRSIRSSLLCVFQPFSLSQNPSSKDPFGPESPVLDQMVWTNIFACLIAIVASLASQATGDFAQNLQLLLTSAPLLWDVCVFSAASAVGLIVLLNTIASFVRLPLLAELSDMLLIYSAFLLHLAPFRLRLSNLVLTFSSNRAPSPQA